MSFNLYKINHHTIANYPYTCLKVNCGPKYAKPPNALIIMAIIMTGGLLFQLLTYVFILPELSEALH